MELKEGMYVRTKDGTIDKITKDEYGVCSCPSSNSVYCEHHILAIFIITKSSYNIIDLIEAGDYVNGEKITRVIPQDICGDEVLDYQHIFINDREIFKEDIKSIVTAQQFENMCYKVGE